VGVSVRGGDAINRMMVQVVSTTCMCIWEYTYVGVYNFNSPMHSYYGVWAEVTLLQVHNSIIM
jgi:hypothetical protein